LNPTPAVTGKSFLVLFFKKEHTFCLAHMHGDTNSPDNASGLPSRQPRNRLASRREQRSSKEH
jgi:hypothetical protein